MRGLDVYNSQELHLPLGSGERSNTYLDLAIESDRTKVVRKKSNKPKPELDPYMILTSTGRDDAPLGLGTNPDRSLLQEVL